MTSDNVPFRTRLVYALGVPVSRASSASLLWTMAWLGGTLLARKDHATHLRSCSMAAMRAAGGSLARWVLSNSHATGGSDGQASGVPPTHGGGPPRGVRAAGRSFNVTGPRLTLAKVESLDTYCLTLFSLAQLRRLRLFTPSGLELAPGWCISGGCTTPPLVLQ